MRTLTSNDPSNWLADARHYTLGRIYETTNGSGPETSKSASDLSNLENWSGLKPIDAYSASFGKSAEFVRELEHLEGLGYVECIKNGMPWEKQYKITSQGREAYENQTFLKKTQQPCTIADKHEDICIAIRGMGKAMERSPSSYEGLGEEQIRDIILLSLSAQFPGGATGETRNGEGKTDILIRVDDINIFIGECKFWKGSEEFSDAINQLLGYTTWRDTNVALLIFNRNKNFSSVLDKIHACVKEHSNFVEELNHKSKTDFRYKFHHPSDEERYLTLTILAFVVPKTAHQSSKSNPE
jgi:hypothetical protein